MDYTIQLKQPEEADERWRDVQIDQVVLVDKRKTLKMARYLTNRMGCEAFFRVMEWPGRGEWPRVIWTSEVEKENQFIA